MHVQAVGEGGPLVVLLHGIPGSGSDWQGVADRLSRNHRVLIPDLMGFANSPRPDGINALWADAQATALEEVLTDPAVVVGHDYGGPVALTLLRRRPDLFRRLVLMATNAFADTPIPLPIRAVKWPVVGGIAERLLMSSAGLRILAGKMAEVGDARQVRATRTIFAAALRELPERYGPIQRSLPEIRVPTTVVWGDQDPFFAVTEAERLAAAIPGAALVVLRGAGHFLPRERPAEVAAAIAG